MSETIATFKLVENFVATHSVWLLFCLPFVTAGLYYLLFRLLVEKERFSKLAVFDHFFPFDHWRGATTRVDVLIYIIQKFTQRGIGAAVAFGTVYLVSKVALLLGGSQPAGTSPHGYVIVIAASLTLFIFADFGQFFSHYIQHKIPVLWEFHKVHHSATFLTPFTTYRFHPLGNFLDAFFAGAFVVIPAALIQSSFGFSFNELLALSFSAYIFSTLFLLGGLQHSHFPISFGRFEWLFISPAMHQLHHSVKRDHWDRNMGSRLALWDILFRTHFCFPKGEKLTYGLGTVEDESGVFQRTWWCYIGPLINVARMTKISPSFRSKELSLGMQTHAQEASIDTASEQDLESDNLCARGALSS